MTDDQRLLPVDVIVLKQSIELMIPRLEKYWLNYKVLLQEPMRTGL
jgi:hypothetical protein